MNLEDETVGYVYTVFEGQICRSLEEVTYYRYVKDYGGLRYFWCVVNSVT